MYEGCSLISAVSFVTRKSALPPESEHYDYKYCLLPTIIIKNQRSVPVPLCNMGLATVAP